MCLSAVHNHPSGDMLECACYVHAANCATFAAAAGANGLWGG
jgi:hypothetical protein